MRLQHPLIASLGYSGHEITDAFRLYNWSKIDIVLTLLRRRLSETLKKHAKDCRIVSRSLTPRLASSPRQRCHWIFLAVAIIFAACSAANAQDPSVVGQWSPLENWP